MSCPICSDETDKKYRPFCSRRCADIDLAKWFSGSYAVPSHEPEDTEQALDAVERGASQKPH